MRMLHLCRFGVSLLLVAISACMVGCDSQPQSQTTPKAKAQPAASMEAKLVGSASYRERIALPPGAELVISLEDVSKADAASEIVATQKQTLTTAPPYEFELSYEASQLKPKARYNLRGQIFIGDQLLFTTTQAYQPFGVPRVDMLLEKVGGKGAVLTTPDNPADDAAQSPTTKAPTTKAPATKAPTTKAPVDASAIIGDWVMLSVNGETIAERAEESPLTLSLLTSGAAHGYSGCNNFRGNYELNMDDAGRSTLTFGPIAGTRKMCQKAMKVESAVLSMLAQTHYFSVAADHLTLIDAQQVELAILAKAK